MKYLSLITFTAALLLAGNIANADPTNTVTLAWNYAPSDISPDMVFKLYSSTNAAAPMPWLLLTNTPATNLQVRIQIEKQAQFFYLTASNWWGESDPSNVASTPAPARSGNSLTIRRGL